jgi:hypothetical protein
MGLQGENGNTVFSVRYELNFHILSYNGKTRFSVRYELNFHILSYNGKTLFLVRYKLNFHILSYNGKTLFLVRYELNFHILSYNGKTRFSVRYELNFHILSYNGKRLFSESSLSTVECLNQSLLNLVYLWSTCLSLFHCVLSPRANYIYRPSDRRLSAKLVQTFADRGCHVVSVTDPIRQYFRFSRPEPLLFLPSSSSVVLTSLSGPRSRPATSQEIW